MAIGGVDATKTKTNHIMEILDVLGIEAARSSIINQIKYTIGIYAINVDIRHINVLADVMTTKGNLFFRKFVRKDQWYYKVWNCQNERFDIDVCQF